MFSDDLLKIYLTERIRLQSQMYELQRQMQLGEQRLKELGALISGIETVAKHDAEEAPKVAAQLEAAEQRAYERGLVEGISRGGQKPDVVIVQPQRKRRGKEVGDVG